MVDFNSISIGNDFFGIDFSKSMMSAVSKIIKRSSYYSILFAVEHYLKVI
jgi:hypothetical protein